MEILNKKIRALFFWSLALSVGFPVGVLGIVFGATKGLWWLLALGIALTVAGFYVMPILWVGYASRRQDRALLQMVEQDHLYTVSALSAQSGCPENDVRERIRKMVAARILKDFLFVGDTLEPNQNQSAFKAPPQSKPCANCGAPMRLAGDQYICDYCLSSASVK